MKRFMIRLLVLLAVLWCGWWALASYGVSQAITSWVDARRDQGMELEAQTSQGGFPFNIATQLTAFEIKNPKTSAVISATGGSLKARTYWPGYIDINLPEDPILLEEAGARTALQATGGQVRLRLRPGFALELGNLQLDAEALALRLNDAELLSLEGLDIAADQTAADRARYDLRLSADALTPGALPRDLLALPADWPAVFDAFTASGAVTFDGPLTRRSFEDIPPQFRQITLTEMSIIWGEVSLTGTGGLDVDAQGVPEGNMTFQVKDWQGLLDLAEGASVLPPDRRGQAELMLRLVANRSGRPEDLDLDLQFSGGQMAFSGIPLGPAPRLVLR